MNIRKLAFVIGAAAVLGSCGGGGGSPTPTPTPPPANNAPTITSDGSAGVAENTAGVVYQVFASDADGDTLTFSISGGADSALFSISATTGELSFIEPQNFEAPADANGDNVYEVTVAVSDGRATVSQTQRITVFNVADAVVLTRVATGLGEVVSMSGVDSTLTLLIARANGDILDFQLNSLRYVEAGNLFAGGPAFDEVRIASMAAQLDSRGQLLVHTIQTTRSGTVRQAALQTFFSRNFGVWESRALHRTETVSAAQEPLVGGTIAKGDGDRVYFLSSDGGEPTRAQFDTTLGNIVRITPETPTTYRATTIGRGLHNPVGASLFDGAGFFIDSGETRYDEVNIFDFVSLGQDFGWPFREGRNEVRAGGAGPFNDPVVEFDRQGADHGLFSAFVYYDAFLQSIAGNFLLATADGRFFILDPADIRDGDVTSTVQPREIVGEFRPNVGTLDDVKAMVFLSSNLLVLDGDGELYLAENEIL